jgi:homogentisate 1,2-dioxygenase
MIPYMKGVVTKQAHVNVPDGTVEEEFARNGFFGKYAHLYRTESPVKWTNIEGELKPRCYDLRELAEGEDFIKGRKDVLYNDDVRIASVKFSNGMKYFYRNADGDDLYFVHKGSGRLETDFGPLAYEPGDYLVIPRGTVYRFDCRGAQDLLLVESFSEISLPDKGMLGQHALFDPAAIVVPEPEATPRSAEGKGSTYDVKIKRLGRLTTVTYPFYPINTVGWKGTLCAWKLNVRDICRHRPTRLLLPTILSFAASSRGPWKMAMPAL